MDGFLTRFLAGEIFNDPLVGKLLLLIIFFLGASQVVKIIHAYWKTGRLKLQEQKVEEEKGQWKKIMEEVLAELKIRNARADKIYDKVQWLYEAHHKFDEDGVPIWYVRKSLETAIEKLAENIGQQTQIMSKMWEEIKDTRREVERVEDKVSTRR